MIVKLKKFIIALLLIMICGASTVHEHHTGQYQQLHTAKSLQKFQGLLHNKSKTDPKFKTKFLSRSKSVVSDSLDIFTAFWYSNNVPDSELKRLMSSGLHASPNYVPLKQILDYGHKVIPFIGGFSSEENEFELRRRVGWYKKSFERIGWENIDCIILMDEPFLKGFTTKQLEWIVDEAHKVYGKEIKVTYMFTRGSILSKDLPKNLDIVGFNFYPLFREDAPEGYAQIFKYKSFEEYFDLILENARKKVPNAQFILTAQIFGTKEGITDSPPWRMPKPETAEWYMKAISKNHDIVGLLFWAWDGGKKWNGLSTSEELQKAWVDALKKYTKNDQ